MPRRKLVEKRAIAPDPKYKSVLISKFINGLMERGKKSTARRVFYDALDIIDQKAQDGDVVSVFESAMENVRPVVEVKSRRVGGATYQVPVEVRPERRNALAIRWIIGMAKGRSGRSMADKLAGELLDASYKRGASV